MGYIKKLKNNELVGGTDKTTIYPVTSTEAVFEEVIEDGESNFKSQKFLNNNITGDRINEGTITDYNIAVGTVTKGKLTPQVQTMLDEGQKKALTPKGNYNLETEYEALDLVFDPVTNSSYISLVTPNVGHPVDENAEGYEEGWWEKTLDGTAINTAQAAIDAKVGQLETQVGTAITQAETAVDEAKQETLNAYTQAEALAQQITDWSSSEISSTPSYTDQHPLSNRASSAQIGYFECGTSSATQASNQIKAVTAGGYALPTSGGAVKIKMYAANTYTPTTNNPVKLQFNADATTLKELRYNGEAVSPDNTWDADEVISVYYDGSVYQASNAQGGSNKKIDAYLYGDLRTLAVGHTYYEAESLKTTDRQFLQMTKPVMAMNITDEVAVGDLKAYSTFTYKALKAVSKYNGTDTEGLYAIGRPSIITITVDASSLSIEQDTDITVTIGEDTQTITVPVAASETKAADIAALIATAFTGIEGWAITDNEDGTLILKCLTGGANTLTITSDVGETGLVITSSAVNGTNNLSKYTEGVWADVTLANYAADSVDIGETPADEMWQKIDLDELISTATIQDTLIEKFRVEDLHKSILNISAGVSTTSPVNNKLNLEAGKRYRMVYKLSAPAAGDYKRFYLRQTYSNNTPNVLVGTIDVGQDTLDTFYVPTETTNYQYPHTWTTAGAFTYSIYVYEVNYVDKVPRLYDELGKKTDGAVRQKALTEMLFNGTFKTLVEYDVDTAPMEKTRYSLGTGNKWMNKNSCNHIVIPCSEGDKFTITPTVYGGFYGWLSDYSVPAANDTIYYSKGNRTWINVDIQSELIAPENTKYLCLVTRDGDGHNCVWTGTADIKTPLYDILHEMVRKAQLEDMVNEKIEQAETDYTNNLNKHIFTPSSYIPVKEGYSTYWDTGSLCYQGCALYGDYLVCISNKDANRIKICNLRDKTTVASSVALPSFPNTRTHANTLSFSNTKYDNGDPFPLLYLCSGYTNTSSTSTSQVYVVRIINNEGTYTTELIQTITLDFGIVNGWTEFVVDAGNNRAWINGANAAYYICVALPSISESAVTINDDTPLIDSFDVNPAAIGVSTKSSGQNRFFYHGRVYFASGVPENAGEGIDALYLGIDNTLTHCREAIVSLKNYGITTEPEACFVWEDDFYVVMRSGAIRKLIQN